MRDLNEWADLHGETADCDLNPWVCIDDDQVAIDAAWRVGRAWSKWESTVGEDDPALPEWLALLTALDRADQEIQSAKAWCGCYHCEEGRRDVAGFRDEAANVAGEWGLPRPPIDGRIPRYPVNVGAIREKAARLVNAGRVHRLTGNVFVVDGDTGAYYVHAAGLDPLEWECSCPWGQPQPDASGRPGRGCAHVTAAHMDDVRQAAAVRAA